MLKALSVFDGFTICKPSLIILTSVIKDDLDIINSLSKQLNHKDVISFLSIYCVLNKDAILSLFFHFSKSLLFDLLSKDCRSFFAPNIHG